MLLSKKKTRTNEMILNYAISMFLDNPIAKVTIKDIAYTAGVGEATIYRNFMSKENLIIEASAKLSNDVLNKYIIVEDSLSGFDQIKQFFMCYVRIFNEHRNYFSFINELDYYLSQNGDINLENYELHIDKYKSLFDKMIQKGLEDHTIKRIANFDLYYYSSTISLLSLAKKLSSSSITKNDEEQNKIKELELLVDIILSYIKGEE